MPDESESSKWKWTIIGAVAAVLASAGGWLVNHWLEGRAAQAAIDEAYLQNRLDRHDETLARLQSRDEQLRDSHNEVRATMLKPLMKWEDD